MISVGTGIGGAVVGAGAFVVAVAVGTGNEVGKPAGGLLVEPGRLVDGVAEEVLPGENWEEAYSSVFQPARLAAVPTPTTRPEDSSAATLRRRV